MKDLKFSFSRTKKLNLNSSYPIVTQVNPYRAYPSRWGVLATVFCLNLANNALWISFSSIATTAAEYYENTVRYDYINIFNLTKKIYFRSTFTLISRIGNCSSF